MRLKPTQKLYLLFYMLEVNLDKEVIKHLEVPWGGASVVNALSEWLEVEIHRDGNIYTQNFKMVVFQRQV